LACLPLLAACSPEPPPLSAVEALDTRPPPDWCAPGQTLTVDPVTGWAACTAYTRAHGEWAGGLIGGVRALQKLAKGAE
jgi:hypothetical protein